MSTIRLNLIDREREPAQKSASATAMLAAFQAAAATYEQVGSDTYDCGNAPSIAGILRWRKGSGATLTMTALGSIDNLHFIRLPDFAAPSAGVSVASVAEETFAVAEWDNNAAPLSGTASDNDLPFTFVVGEYRFIKLYAKVDNATGGTYRHEDAGTGGTAASKVWAGTTR